MRSFPLFSIVLLLSAGLVGCQPNRPGERKPSLASHFLRITDREDRGIKEVLNLYGGEAEYGFAKKTGGDGKEMNLFWITIQKSESIEQSVVDPRLILSNIAFVFFRNLGEEGANYTHIQATIKRAAGEVETAFSVPLLTRALQRYRVVEELVASLRKMDYDRLASRLQLDANFYGKDGTIKMTNFIRDVKTVDTASGRILEVVPYGFRQVTKPNGVFIYFLSVLVCEKRKHPLAVVVKIDEADSKVYFMDYSF